MNRVEKKGNLLRVTKASGLSGRARVAGDKSISHRALMIGAISNGSVEVEGFLPSKDCLATLSCLEAMGVEASFSSKTSLTIKGRGMRGLTEPKDILYAANSGTTMRILPGILAGQDFFSVIGGDSSLLGRPMGRIIEPLRAMGGKVFGRANGTKPPLAIVGSKLNPIDYELPVASAQVKSCILLASLFADGISRVIEKAPSRDHTERMLSLFGANIKSEDGIIEIEPNGELNAQMIDIPADPSSAAFLIAAALIVENSNIVVESVGSNPTRSAFFDVVASMGGSIEIRGEKAISNEPRADLAAASSSLHATQISGPIIPNIVDELVIFAVLATQAKGQTIVKDAKELRVKESDRIAAVVGELKKMGAQIEEQPDGFIVTGPTQLLGANVDSHGDHRMAMALTVAGLVAQGETIIAGADSIDISFPGFIETMNSLIKGGSA